MSADKNDEWTVPRFWFDGNIQWGWIDTREDWGSVVAAYDRVDVSSESLMGCWRGPDKNGSPTYGDMVIDRHPGTLADHFGGQS